MQLLFGLDFLDSSVEKQLQLHESNPVSYSLGSGAILVTSCSNDTNRSLSKASEYTNAQSLPPVQFVLKNVDGDLLVELSNNTTQSVKFLSKYLPVNVCEDFDYSTSSMCVQAYAEITYGLSLAGTILNPKEKIILSISPLIEKLKNDGVKIKKCRLKFLVLDDLNRYAVVDSPWVSQKKKTKALKNKL